MATASFGTKFATFGGELSNFGENTMADLTIGLIPEDITSLSTLYVAITAGSNSAGQANTALDSLTLTVPASPAYELYEMGVYCKSGGAAVGQGEVALYLGAAAAGATIVEATRSFHDINSATGGALIQELAAVTEMIIPPGTYRIAATPSASAVNDINYGSDSVVGPYSRDNSLVANTLLNTWGATGSPAANSLVAWARLREVTSSGTKPTGATIRRTTSPVGGTAYDYSDYLTSSSQAIGADWFDEVVGIDFKVGDLMYCWLQDGYKKLRFTSPTTAALV